MTRQRWLITGCSSGTGRALADRLARGGERVLVTARNEAQVAPLRAFGPHVATTVLDVCDPRQCAAAVEYAIDRFGGVDVLVNNAGYGQFGVVEEVSDAELAAQFDTNVYGPWRMVREVLPYWRANGRGHAVFCSSLSGSFAFPGLSAYTASKFALEGLAEALAVEAGGFGVKVTILQMGGFATGYGDKLREPAHRINAYDPVTADMLGRIRMMAGSSEVSSPELFARVVHRLAALPDPPFRLPLGAASAEYLETVLDTRRKQFDQARTLRLDRPEGAF